MLTSLDKTILKTLVTLCLLSGTAWAGEPPKVVLQTIAMEAADQPVDGQAMVALTLINRARMRGTMPEIEALRPKQYSCWNDPLWAKRWLDKHYTPSVRLRALNAYKKAIVGGYPDITHYHTLDVRPYWAKGHKPALVVGNHAFYGGID